MTEQPTYEITQILEQMRADYWRNLETADQAEAALERGGALPV